jgi:hypothetical protein
LKAVQGRDLAMVKLLIEAGANPDIADNSGTSARSAADSDIEACHERGDFTGHRAAIASAARHSKKATPIFAARHWRPRQRGYRPLSALARQRQSVMPERPLPSY